MQGRHFAAVALILTVILLLPTAAAAKKPPKPGGGGGGGGGTFSTTSTYVKDYANIVNGVQFDLFPLDVQATPDAGSIALATTYAPSPSGSGTGPGVSWLLKTSAFGAPQWQEEVGCLSTPPGAYSDNLSLQLTNDGGYVVAGGTIGCGSGNDCPALSGIQCALVEKVGATGQLEWARVYDAGANGTEFDAIRTTSDGGFVAAGSATDANHNLSGLLVKLDGVGNVQWQRLLGPTGTNQVYLHDVQQTSDGGYVAAGQLHDGSASNGEPLESAVAVKLDAAGNVSWPHAYNDVDSGGSVTAAIHAFTIVQTAGGGFAIGGNWATSSSFLGTCCSGALLLQLTSSGAIQSQTAYSGGLFCFDNGFSNTCTAIGGVIESLHQASDGGFALAGEANIELRDEAPLVPWLAKVDSSGGIVWQEQDYQVNSSTGRPLSEEFDSSALNSVGPVAVGRTENYSNGLGELLGVQTDMNGAVGNCSQVHLGSPLSATNPGLMQFTPSVAASTASTSQSPSPAQTLATTTTATTAQC